MGEEMDMPGSDVSLAPGEGFYHWSRYQDGLYGFFRMERAGVFWDKLVALQALTVRDWGLSFTIDERYFINFYDLFPIEMTELFGAYVEDDDFNRAPRVAMDGADPQIYYVNLLRGNCRSATTGEFEPCVGPVEERFPGTPIMGTVLNNAGRAHLEGFGSIEGVARAKAEIIHGLGPDGVFVFNADDAFAPLWRELGGAFAQRTFGIVNPADVSSPAGDYEIVWHDNRFHARFPVVCAEGEVELGMQLAGEHNRMNALAAIAAALLVGADLDDARHALAGLAPVPGRLCPMTGANGARLIDDSYNANPDSVVAALRVLVSAPGRRTLVLGDLAELGDDAVALHHQLGVRAAEFGVDGLLTVGNMSAAAGRAFGVGHRHFATRDELAAYLGARLSGDDTVLVKGSRSARMDEVVRQLRAAEVSC